MQPAGAKFLKVTGILMIIFGAISIVFSIIGFLGMGIIEASGVAKLGLLWVAMIIGFAGSVAELVAGIIGVINCEKPEKAQTCLILGIIVAALTVLSSLFTLIAYSENFSVFSLFSGLVVPVLYIIGALKNKQN